MVSFWSRFVHKHDAHQNLSRFWSPPISFWSRSAGETNICSNPAIRIPLGSKGVVLIRLFVVTIWPFPNKILTHCLAQPSPNSLQIASPFSDQPISIPKIPALPIASCCFYQGKLQKWLLVVSICTSLIIVLLFFGSMGRGLLSMGKQSMRKTCRCPAIRCYKARTFGLGPTPPE